MTSSDPIVERLENLAASASKLPLTTAAELKNLVRNIRQARKANKPFDRNLRRAEKLVVAGQQEIHVRHASSPAPTFPPELPVSRERKKIAAAVKMHPVVIVCGDTGSGKTTQLPKICLELGRGIAGTIGCTQPRRIAATSTARRVAEELSVTYGKQVGCKVRFKDETSPDTLIKFMTDGILLAETQGDRNLWHYDTLIVDEAHERSLNIDFLLGYLRNLLRRRGDLKMIISSATLDAEAFAEFFHGAPVIRVAGRSFPIEDRYQPPQNEDETIADHVLRAVESLRLEERDRAPGDVLVFLPGEREIRDCHKKLNGRKWAHTEILPLFARLSLVEQQRVFKAGPKRRIVLATNVAETSLTIPNIAYVIDSGLARISGYNPRTQVQTLRVRSISQASARQRRGRCGRIRAGICIRLYDEEDFEARPAFTQPEIRRSSLAGVILRMKALGLPDIAEFPFVDPPQQSLIQEGLRTLRDIGAIDRNRKITKLGRDLVRFPIDPRMARMLVEAERRNCLAEIMIIAAGLSIQDPRDRPTEKAEEADAAHAQWVDPDSDFLSLLSLWQWLRDERSGSNSRRILHRLCRRHFVSFRRIQEWQNIHRELREVARDMKWKPGRLADSPAYDAVHQAILAGIPGNIGGRGEQHEYIGTRGQNFWLFPGSGLFDGESRPEWIAAFALIETTRLYARQAAIIEPEWLEDIAPHLCRYSYTHVGWSEGSGTVTAKEQVNLGSLRIVSDRRVHYGSIFPGEAREIFIRSALAPGNLRSRGKWLAHHRAVLEKIRSYEARIRRPETLADPDAVAAFFEPLIPRHIHTARAFDKWRYQAEKSNPRMLFIEIQQAMHADAQISLEDYPDEIEGLKLRYAFAPGEANDGITLEMPLEEIPRVPTWLGSWLVPGWRLEKAEMLIRALPKSMRPGAGPPASLAREFLETVPKPDSEMPDRLALWLTRKLGRRIMPRDFDPARIPAHFRMQYAILDADGNELAVGDDLHRLRERLQENIQLRFEELTPVEWEMHGLTTFPVDQLPDEVDIGASLTGWPALFDEGATAGMRVFTELHEAEANHRFGIGRLFRIRYPNQMQYLEENLPLQPFTRATLCTLGWQAKNNLKDFVWLAIDQALGGGEAIRSRREFELACLRAVGELHSTAKTIGTHIETLIDQYEVISGTLEEIREKAAFIGLVADVNAQLRGLFRNGWLIEYDGLQDVPRWLQGIRVRLERARHAVARDEKKMESTRPWAGKLKSLIERYESRRIWPREAVAFARLLEEFRINIFAPEVGSRRKASDKRLQAAWEKAGN